MRMLRLALFCLLAWPATAWAEPATIVSRDLPLGNSRTTAGVSAPGRFDLVGLHWQGSGRVVFRTRSTSGRWSAWRPAAPEAEDRPDQGSAESRARKGWRLGSPYWVGASDRIDYRVSGDVHRLRAWYVWSPIEGSAERTVAMAGSPRIVPRSGWNADEKILRAPPSYSKTVAFAVVHHTAGANDYSAEASAAIVRAIELYHVRGNGWNDIGYNFLVDRYGNVFEGRAGGIDRNVIGAHAEGFNTGSVGVAVIGNYSSQTITPAAEHALARLLAWRLDVAHVDPLGQVSWTSGGNPKFRKGTPVLLRTISGHRDTGFTACPGNAFYGQLPDLAHEVANIGLPKLYDPTVTGSLGGRIEFDARLSGAGPWVVTVRNAAGDRVARGTGSSAVVAWTWNSAGAAPGRYTWTIEAGAARPAEGTIGRAPPAPVPGQPPSRPPTPAPPVLPPAPRPTTPSVPSGPILSGLAVAPAVISPGADGTMDPLTISYTLAGRASVTATVDDSTGVVVDTLFAGQKQGARRQSFPYPVDGLAGGQYVLTIAAVGEDGRTGTLQTPFTIDRTLTDLSLTSQALTPNGDGTDDTLGILFTLASNVDVTIRIQRAGIVVATPFLGPLPVGPAQVTWDGSTPEGPAPDGEYEAVVIVNTPFGIVTRSLPFTLAR